VNNLTVYSDGPCPLWLLDLLPVSGECIQAYRHGEEINGGFIRNGSILICTAGEENRFVSYCERRSYHYGLFLNGDENWEDSMGYITSPYCTFIVRNYAQPIAERAARLADCIEKLLYVRVGCSNSFFKATKQSPGYGPRPYHWSFVGQLKPGRIDAIEQFSQLGHGYLHLTDEGFAPEHNKKTALTAEHYWQILKTSRFTLCPMGWVNIDTQRVYEALDAGSIPVVPRCQELSTTPYWPTIFPSDPPAPFVIETSWEAARLRCAELLASGEAEDLARECSHYWQQTQTYWRQKINHYMQKLSSFC
jgi:hypothetical protein